MSIASQITYWLNSNNSFHHRRPSRFQLSRHLQYGMKYLSKFTIALSLLLLKGCSSHITFLSRTPHHFPAFPPLLMVRISDSGLATNYAHIVIAAAESSRIEGIVSFCSMLIGVNNSCIGLMSTINLSDSISLSLP